MKKFERFNILLVLVLLITSSCDKYELNEFEIDYLQAYNVGDSLIYKSINSGSIKKYLIVDKQNKLKYDLHNIYDAGNERHSIVWYKEVGAADTEKKSIISIFNNDDESHHIFLTFEDFWGEYYNNFGAINSKDTIKVFSKKIIDYYELVGVSDIRYPTDLKKIYWQNKNGIVKFDLKNGDSFVKINAP